MSGFGGMVSFDLLSRARTILFERNTDLAESLGGVILANHPAYDIHIPEID
jgi:cystathionine beta-lyase/cystathionine gamma-synthase